MPKCKFKVTNEDRFEEISDKALEEKQENVKNPNTLKSDVKCKRIFVNYITARHKDLDLNYWEWDPKVINDILSKFWFVARNEQGDGYRVSTLKHIHYGINCMMERKGYDYNIISNDIYKPCQKAFAYACAEPKKLGYGYVVPHKEIIAKVHFFTHLTCQNFYHCKHPL